MAQPTVDELFKKKMDFLAKAESRLGRQLALSERKLLRNVIKSLENLYKTGGVSEITATRMATEISNTFATWMKGEYSKVISRMAYDQIEASLLNKEYFAAVTLDKKQVERVARRVARANALTFGFKETSKGLQIIPGGFLDTILKDSHAALRTRVIGQIGEAVATGEGFAATSARIRKMIDDTSSLRGGMLERHYKTYVYDSYAKKDRIESDTYAQEFNLTAFVYRGTVIKKTRSFCKHKANKVFLRSEAKLWKKQDFPGKNDNYNPVRDLGGWNCRHYAQFISNESAMRRRSDLRINSQGKLVTN